MTEVTRALTDKQQSFVRYMVQTGDCVTAATLAGYEQPEIAGYHVRDSKGVAAALPAAMLKALVVEGAPLAYKLLIDTLKDPDQPRKLRLECAKTILDRSGFVAPKASENKGLLPASLVDMTASDLHEASAMIANELANRARPIIDNAPVIETDDAQLSELLE